MSQNSETTTGSTTHPSDSATTSTETPSPPTTQYDPLPKKSCYPKMRETGEMKAVLGGFILVLLVSFYFFLFKTAKPPWINSGSIIFTAITLAIAVCRWHCNHMKDAFQQNLDYLEKYKEDHNPDPDRYMDEWKKHRESVGQEQTWLWLFDGLALVSGIFTLVLGFK